MLRFADFYADRRQTTDKPIALPLLRMRARGVKINMHDIVLDIVHNMVSIALSCRFQKLCMENQGFKHLYSTISIQPVLVECRT